MPRIFDQTTVIIQSGGGGGANAAWGPDFGDPSDGISVTARGAADLEALGLGTNLTINGAVGLFSTITGNLNLTAIGQVVAVFNAIFPTITAQGQARITALATRYDLLIALGAVAGVFRPTYTQICQILADLEALAISYPSKLTAQGQIATTEALVYNLLTTLGTIGTYNIRLTNTRTCQGLIDLEALALGHTRSCTCTARNTARSIVFTGPYTCQASIATLVYELDYVGAAVDTDISLTVPSGVVGTNPVISEVWGGGGAGGLAGAVTGGGGGGGGGYAHDSEATAIDPGDILTIRVGSGGVTTAGGESYVKEGATTYARSSGGGLGGTGGATNQGAGGTAGDATNGGTLRDGGVGGGGGAAQTNGGGGGGGSGTANAGGAGASNRTAGTAGTLLGGAGGTGGATVGNVPATAGSERGGGGGGASTTSARAAGAKGGVRIRFTIPTP